MSAADVIVVGSGVAGLTAARELARQGRRVAVLDKGRRPGGRLASRTLSTGAIADHGAQFFTARDPRFAEQVAAWTAAGAAREWCRGFSGSDGHPRYSAPGGMARLAGHMAEGLEVTQSVHVELIEPEGERWRVSWRGGHGRPAASADAPVLIVTTPVPQAQALLGGPLSLPAIRYEATVSLLVALSEPPSIPSPGGVQLPGDETWSWIADNVAKGASSRPAVTLHTTAGLAEQIWDEPAERITERLLTAGLPWLGDGDVLDVAVHRWRYATPLDPLADRCLALAGGRLILAGDAFAGPRVEGAYLSGLAAGAAALDALG